MWTIYIYIINQRLSKTKSTFSIKLCDNHNIINSLSSCKVNVNVKKTHYQRKHYEKVA